MNKVVDVPLEVERVNLIKQRFLTLASFMTLESFLSGWFFEAPIEDIHRENVEEFVAYGFYCRTMEELPLNVRILLRLSVHHPISQFCICFDSSSDYLWESITNLVPNWIQF